MSSGTLSATPQTSPLQAMRLSRGWSREVLAAEAGVSAKTIYNVEVAGQWPHRSTRRVLALALGVAVDEIFPTTSEAPGSNGDSAKPEAAGHGPAY